ncbi:MAG: phage tail tube protein [Oscillospiraceae bacterium]|jgi:hypothetical protein|nr:phage tail tube protein [Oscillospiraceae bacterium]
MAAAKTMNARDAVSGALAECYVTIAGKRYRFMQLINFQSGVTKEKSEVPILGRTGKGHKSSNWKGSFKGLAHYNQSVLRQLLLDYKNNGEDLYFDIQVTNDDPGSAVGRQTIVHKGCNINGGTLARFDANADFLDETIEGTFDDWEMPEKFRLLEGM